MNHYSELLIIEIEQGWTQFRRV